MVLTQGSRPLPLGALGLSLASLAVPVAGVFAFPEWVQEDQGMLIWMTALIPAFLLGPPQFQHSLAKDERLIGKDITVETRLAPCRTAGACAALVGRVRRI